MLNEREGMVEKEEVKGGYVAITRRGNEVEIKEVVVPRG